MQRSWRSDPDKLTFIVCLPIDGAPDRILCGSQDSPGRMLGDVNLFLSAAGDDPEDCVGELEIMIARPSLRRRGYGRAAIVAFLHYVAQNIYGILDEYRKSQSAEKMSLAGLRVKIGSKNEKSIRLFESIGFIQTKEGPNFFNEIELSMDGAVDEAKTTILLQQYDMQGYREIRYAEVSV
jgi:RimJ/RimL family protein N-acetyltransferase